VKPDEVKRSYEFGPFRLDPEDRTLSRDGELVPLTIKAFDTLLALVENVAREDLNAVDEARGMVRTEAGFNMPPNELGTELGIGEGIAGLVLEARQPLRFSRYGDVPQPTQTRYSGVPSPAICRSSNRTSSS